MRRGSKAEGRVKGGKTADGAGRTAGLDGAVQLARSLPLAQLAVAGAVAEVAAAGAHPVCGRGAGKRVTKRDVARAGGRDA